MTNSFLSYSVLALALLLGGLVPHRVQVLKDSHVDGPGHPVLVILLFQAGRFLAVAEETALHYDNGRLYVKKKILIIIGLGQSFVGFSQHIIKPFL